MRARFQLDQLGSIILVSVSHQERAFQHRDVLVGLMPMRRHFDLVFATDPDHVQATPFVRISRDDGYFNAGYEWLPDQLAWRDYYVALRES
ncbi:MAG: hypothetical protein DME04_26940 [Candidatus Rokuibacteriota bacterium]|nr:MAG: hypothetical protein DME04_26940 [Candidatus Rokubacteria bacterium]